MTKKTVQKVKKKEKNGNEQYKSIVIGGPKSVINKSKLDGLYELDRRHAQAVNEWIENWYWRLDMVERILAGRRLRSGWRCAKTPRNKAVS